MAPTPAQWRARQTRIEANRSQDAEARGGLLRQAEAALWRCLELDPEDGRPYVSLGKILVQQRRYDEAAKLYEEGCAATGGTNAHIWTAWAYLAGARGDLALARRLYDAALVRLGSEGRRGGQGGKGAYRGLHRHAGTER